MGKKTAPVKKPVTVASTEPAKRGTERPFVSVICPTYNRRQFLPNLIHQFNYQTYPQSYMELIILDDSPTSNADIIPKQGNIKYTHLPEKLILGRKRNLINSMTTGDIIVCFDDDDYYSPERVAHAVNKLQSTKCQIAGSSVIHIFYPRLDKIIEFGPYAPYHGTNGTMAYTKKYLKTHSYLDDKTQAEEAHFTNNFSEPMVQLDPHKVMLCVAHNKNTVEKDQFLNQGKTTGMKMQKFFKINDKHMIEYLKTLGTRLQQEVSQPVLQEKVPDLVEDVPDLVEDVPDLVEDVPDLVEDVPDLVEVVPDLVEVVPDLVEVVPDLVEDRLKSDEEKANVFHQLENIKKNLEDLQLQQNNLRNELKEQIQTEGVEINPQILEQFKSEDLINILNKINEFGPVELENH